MYRETKLAVEAETEPLNCHVETTLPSRDFGISYKNTMPSLAAVYSLPGTLHCHDSRTQPHRFFLTL